MRGQAAVETMPHGWLALLGVVVLAAVALGFSVLWDRWRDRNIDVVPRDCYPLARRELGDCAYPIQMSGDDPRTGLVVREMKGISMLINEGIAVNTWVNLDSSCCVEPEVFADELQIEFGSRPGSLKLVIAEEMVDRLAVVLADAKARFREMDEEAERAEPGY